MEGEVNISIDVEKYEIDTRWDGIKGYILNAKLDNQMILQNYRDLWHIEKAFRMSKTDLRIRPIYHRSKDRIEAHICITFTIYKELEGILYENNSLISLKNPAEITHNMYQVEYKSPDSKHSKSILLKMDEKQQELYDLVHKNFTT